jgi:rRNA maturation endonuclease Nob1
MEKEITHVSKSEMKDEWWAYVEKCLACTCSFVSGGNFCPNCGRRIVRDSDSTELN